jgi:hypothetical protein
MNGSESGPLPTRPGHIALWIAGYLWCLGVVTVTQPIF